MVYCRIGLFSSSIACVGLSVLWRSQSKVVAPGGAVLAIYFQPATPSHDIHLIRFSSRLPPKVSSLPHAQSDDTRSPGIPRLSFALDVRAWDRRFPGVPSPGCHESTAIRRQVVHAMSCDVISWRSGAGRFRSDTWAKFVDGSRRVALRCGGGLIGERATGKLTEARDDLSNGFLYVN